ncbi:MAG: hypothetical protein QM528_05540 [Phycisphaerales bacterium]|nr:hypothetical protein [Phycisphaerales bacterium]
MSKILIADSGSTKCHWSIVFNGKPQFFTAPGISPYFCTKEEIDKVIKKLRFYKSAQDVDHVYFYGTGLAHLTHARVIKKVLALHFKKAKIYVGTDMEAAAYATSYKKKSVVSILGTGSNCALYDGKRVMRTRNGLGFILGDEGSGAYLGKILIQNFLNGLMDPVLANKFRKIYKHKLDRACILDSVYKKPFPNRYLASYVSFLADNIEHPAISSMVQQCIRDFFEKHLLSYKESFTIPIHFVGGVAYQFQDTIKSIASGYHMTIGNILKDPMKGLIDYHTN